MHDGASAPIDKVAAIAAWPQALVDLRCCDLAGRRQRLRTLRKCVRTAMAFLALGYPVPPSLCAAPPTIENRTHHHDALCRARHARCRCCRSGAGHPRGVDSAAESRVAEFAAQPPPSSAAVDLRRRLDYVLGGIERAPRKRVLRRILRAARGATGPRDMARSALQRWRNRRRAKPGPRFRAHVARPPDVRRHGRSTRRGAGRRLRQPQAGCARGLESSG